MKKGLLSILASALLVVGCQNYDDQFSALETQINALASTVAGLSQVQSDLTSLANTVNSLQSSVASTVDAALADGLADIDAAVASLEAAAADAASAEDVAAIQASVDANAVDLDELLASSSVFNGSITINSVATLNAFHSMGSSLAIVNGDVTFLVGTDMDMVKVQETADQMLTITGDLSYTSKANTIAEVVFNNLSGTASLTLEQAGGYHFPALVSVTNMNLSDKFESTITRVNFPALSSVTSLGTDNSTNHTVEFTKATEMSFAALAYYTPGTLILKQKRGTAELASTLDISTLDDVDALGEQAALALSISGPNSLSISNMDGKGGSITLDGVDTAVINDFDGTITINDKVTNFTSNNVVAIAGTMADVVTLDITGAIDPNDTADKSGPAIALTQDDFDTVTLAGNLASISIDDASRLTTLNITADVNAGSISLTNNGDLENLNLTGSKATGVTFTNNNRIASADVNTTIQKSVAAGSTLDGSVVVTNNSDLESLDISSTNVAVLTITGNPLLATIDATGLSAIGATAASNAVNIYGNLITFSKSKDNTDTATTGLGLGKVGDIGQYTTTSKFATLKTYLTLVAANASASANVYVDVIDSVVGTDGVEDDSDVTYSSSITRDTTTADAQQKILVKTANTADGGATAVTAKRSFLFTGSQAFEMYANGTAIVANGSKVAANTNQQLFVNGITTDAILANAAAAGISMTATKNARPAATIAINTNSSAMENSQTSAKATFSFAVSDTFTISIDGLSATITATATGGATASTNTFVDAIVAAWNTAHALTATAARWTLATAVTVSTDPGGLKGIKITATASDPGSREIDAPMSASWSTTGFLTDSSVGIAIGNVNNFTKSSADNVAQGDEVLVTLTANTAGDLLSEIGNYGKVQANEAKNVSTTTLVVELSSSLNVNVTPSTGFVTTTDLHVDESRLDVAIPGETVAAAASNAVDFTRVHWL